MDPTTYKAISHARMSLSNGEKTFMIYDKDKLINSSDERGLKPFLDAIENVPEMLEGATIGDRIVGRAAALMCVYSKVKVVYSQIMSAEAIDILEKNDILATWQEVVPYLVERDLSSIYKLDLYLKEIDDPAKAVKMIKEYTA